MNIETLMDRLENSPESLEFADVIQLIDDNYSYKPTEFRCGEVKSEAGSNEGSCRILAFAKLNGLSAKQTLYLFGRYYREDVLNHPDGEDHGNIRNFLKCGWSGVSFNSDPLTKL